MDKKEEERRKLSLHPIHPSLSPQTQIHTIVSATNQSTSEGKNHRSARSEERKAKQVILGGKEMTGEGRRRGKNQDQRCDRKVEEKKNEGRRNGEGIRTEERARVPKNEEYQQEKKKMLVEDGGRGN